MTSEMATTGARELTHGALEFSEEQRQMIRDSFANGASDAEFAVLMEIAKARRLNPLLRQIHFVSRYDTQKGRSVWSAQVSIDGLRAIAERTGLYAGQDEPEFSENPDGTLLLCKVRVYRKDWPRPAVGVAYWSEYVQTFKDRQTGKERPAPMWARMPHVMLAKVAEAVGLRKAFPEDMSGLYAPEEMAQASNGSPAEDASEEPRALQSPAGRVVFAPTAETSRPVTLVRPGPQRAQESHEAQPASIEPAALADASGEALEKFLTRVEGISLPGEGVAVWLKHRADLAELPGTDREQAWKALCKRVEKVGKMKNAHTWLKRAVQEADARGPQDDPDGPGGGAPCPQASETTDASGDASWQGSVDGMRAHALGYSHPAAIQNALRKYRALGRPWASVLGQRLAALTGCDSDACELEMLRRLNDATQRAA